MRTLRDALGEGHLPPWIAHTTTAPPYLSQGRLWRFLLETSILDQFCGSLCDATLGAGSGASSSATFAVQAYSQLLLDEADRHGLFLIALNDQRH